MEKYAATTTYEIPFPVILFDGERDTNVGDIKIHKDLVFNEFQTILTQMTGIHYDDLTTYLVDNRNSSIYTKPMKIPITERVNFAVMVRLRDCYFHVVLNRPRTECRMVPGNQSDLLRMHWDLRELNNKKGEMSAYYDYNYDYGFGGDLLMQSENYLNNTMNAQMYAYYDYNEGFDGYLLMQSKNYWNTGSNSIYGFVSPENKNIPMWNWALCEGCIEAQKQGKAAEFHFCVYDEVVKGFFRSPAGPISRRR